MKATPRKQNFIRMFAIYQLSRKFSFEAIAESNLITYKTLNNWINRFNKQGIDGLIDKTSSGRPRHIDEEKSKRYCHLIDNPKEAGETHWTAKKFHGYLSEHLNHEVGYTTVLRWLKDNNYRLKVPRPWPDVQDEEARNAFVKRLQSYLNDGNIDIWYGDEMGVDGDPRPRRRWAQIGEKITVPHNGGHIRANVTGIVCPRTGEFYALEFSHSDSVIFQTFLDYANKDLKPERKRNILILDNASWHKNKTLNWGNFEPIYLPPYSPDLNPIERLWLLIKAEWFTDFIAKTHAELIERLDKALCWAADRTAKNQITCSI
ncbi:MAG: IS630 family transposase [Nitrospirae bacterium]|nr:IS630 family transposase [Nitrospirota bacterium]